MYYLVYKRVLMYSVAAYIQSLTSRCFNIIQKIYVVKFKTLLQGLTRSASVVFRTEQG